MSVFIIASVLGSIAFVIVVHILVYLCFKLYIICQHKREKNDKSRMSVISEIQPYGDITDFISSNDATSVPAGVSTGAFDMNVYATFGDATPTGSENVYYKETKVPAPGENVYYKETSVQGGENVYYKETQVQLGENIYFKETKAEGSADGQNKDTSPEGDIYNKEKPGITAQTQKPADIVEYAVPDLSKKKSRKEPQKTETEQEMKNELHTRCSMSVMV